MALHRDMSDLESFSEICLAQSQRELDSGRVATAADAIAGYVGGLAWINPPLAAEKAVEAVALARRSGMPSTIAANLAFQAIALAGTDPMTARRLLLEAVTTGTENWSILQTECTAAGRLGEWDLLVRLAQRLFWLDRRSGVVAQEILLGLFNFVARALSSHDPDAAAVLQGAVVGLSKGASRERPRSDEAPSSHGMAGVTRRSTEDPFGDFMRQVRRDCTSALVEAIGQEEIQERRAEGAAMDRDQACAYVRARIDGYLISGQKLDTTRAH